MGDETEFIRRKTLREHGDAMVKQLLYWKLAIFKATGKAVGALIASLIASLNEKNWSDFSDTGKFIVVATAILAMWQVLEAFLNTTLSDLQKPKSNGKSESATQTTTPPP